MSSLHADEERHEFDAVLQVPFHADTWGERVITLRFTVAPAANSLRWRLALLPRHDETAVRSWQGMRTVAGEPVEVTVHWREDVPKGVYRMKLWASLDGGGEIEQSWPVAVGAATTNRRAIASFAAAVPPATAATALYDIYLGNLHSQTNHSDGGGVLDQCTGAQEPQHGAFGPSDAYAYAQQHGLDFLMTSEHNHMFDGSDGTNRAADASAVRALFQDGLRQAAQWRTDHPPFLALYGQEWGVISQGGHINILNADALLGWERNAQGELLADEETPKSDYQTLYQHLRQHHWFGQFNHPQRDQFAINGQPLAWSADGDASMLLCEVMNSSAYSTSTDENEPRRSNFEAGCNALLEAGYHLAFSSNQDNHCANWGAAYSNRTAVLLPRSTPLTPASLLDALQARRIYATMDKRSQLIFTANGHMMGERFQNRGKLTLKADYANGAGRSIAAISIFHGVPGRNGTVAAISTTSKRTLTPLPGEHFYYARVTQDDGKMLWSAPVWVTQLPR
ncbi:phosphotransferase [Duganella sp. CY42W]|uniref:Phosphotransferase n=1 Tax=Duganella levis TaxID=2692169 RepID=A0ABW9VYE7_9BURK|nr:CehA/McbA family metallohydrolase [Duganella levis]MYN26686.1 phosphotransferase [Duganella levis]